MLSLLFLLEATTFAICGIFVRYVYPIVMIGWICALIPAVIAAYFSSENFMKYSDQIDLKLNPLKRAVAGYSIVCLIISVISTCVVLLQRTHSEKALLVHFLFSLMQVSYLAVTAGCHKFCLTTLYIIESYAFFFGTLLMSLTITLSTLSSRFSDEGCALLTCFISIELTIVIVYHVIRILKIYPLTVRDNIINFFSIYDNPNNTDIAPSEVLIP
jgi:hypothetical protein